MRVRRLWIPPGELGVRRTVSEMRTLAREHTAHPLVRGEALKIVAGIPGRDAGGQAFAIRSWLDQQVQFRRDPTENELLYGPLRALLILRKRGPPLYLDCDDVAVLAAALGRSVGLRARFVVVGFGTRPRAPFRHVWTELASPHGDVWHEMDVTRAEQFDTDVAITRRWIVRV